MVILFIAGPNIIEPSCSLYDKDSCTIRNSIITSCAISRRNSKTSSSLNVGQSDARCTLVFLRFNFFPLRSNNVTLTHASIIFKIKTCFLFSSLLFCFKILPGNGLFSIESGRKFFASSTTTANLAALCK